ncbi:MAG TPA: VWA domain-containing protein [Gemmatales bacterium]|nr:VWA domain-containing protein [Gemmatales bacterium]
MRPRWIVATILSLILAGLAAYVASTGWYALQFGWAKPWWLLLFALLPFLAVFAWPVLVNLGQFRRLLVLTLRMGLFICLILALAELSTVHQEEGMALLVVVDKSFSIPQEVSASSVRDARWERLVDGIKQATRERVKVQDRVGVLSFAARPRLEYPVSDVPELSIRDIGGGLDRNTTDIGAAIRAALAAFPPGAARRILLISDGNENRGDAEAEARTAKLNGVPIDVVPIKYKYDEEILVDRIDVPSESRPGQDIPLRVVARNYAGRPVPGKLQIVRTMGEKTDQAEQRYTLEPGLNVMSVKWPARFGQGAGLINYKATYIPDKLPNDRQDNNVSWAPVMLTASGRRVLLVVQDKSLQAYVPLMQALTRVPGPKGERVIDVWNADTLPADDDQGRLTLSNYDTIVMFNLPSEAVPRAQQEAIRKTVRDQGTGLVFIGGPTSFGAGGWQNEPLEEAMPVDSALRSRKIQAKGGLALIMHASEMAEGNFWQKEIAKLAISKLSPIDEVGLLYYTYGLAAGGNNGHIWHVPLQEVGDDKNRANILSALGSMQPGDMPQFDPSMKMALDSLTEEKRGIATKHVILISDGDHGLLTDKTILDKYKKARVTMTTIGITTHGPAAQAALADLSKATGGRHYAVDDPKKLPSIYVKETRILNQSYLYEKGFQPRMTSEVGDPFREWTKAFPTLFGFVRTSRKESNLVQVLMQAPIAGEDDNPIYAQWQYGLGRSVAFTSDAMGGTGSWAREWIANQQPLYGDFWTKVIDWSMRNLDDSGISLMSRYENGKMRVTIIDNRDREARAKKPLGTIKATIGSSGSSESKEIVLEPVSAGVYEGSVDTTQAGNYSVAASMVLPDKDGPGGMRSVIVGRGAMAVPYSPEFATVEDNAGLLERIAEVTGGRVLDEQTFGKENLFLHEGSYARRLQPIWHWLLFAAAVMLVCDAATRRIAIDPVLMAQRTKKMMQEMRGPKELAETSQEYLGRLKKGKAAAGVAVAEPTVVTDTASRKFEAPTDFTAPTSSTPTTKPSTPTVAKPKEAEGDDFAARLMKAKKKAREEMDEHKEG